MLIVNADDLGRTQAETDAALQCFAHGRITSATAMVFMEDSERAARLAGSTTIDVGLHLNLTQPFAVQPREPAVARAHSRVVRHLERRKLSRLFYHPALRADFRLVCDAQLAEFVRLYGRAPSHLDGHHHMHLCANVLLGNVIPKGVRMRRHFHFWPGEKNTLNRIYRRIADRILTRRHPSTDYFFALSQCFNQERMNKVIGLARSSVVEVMVHPANPCERDYLLSETWSSRLVGINKGTYSSIDRISS